jgi:HAE1 family hydrophobic/amphiphilic exporter-1
MAPERQGAPVTLGDVATIERRPDDAKSLSRTNGKTSLAVDVMKEQDANTVNVVHEVEDLIEELQDDPSLDGVDFHVVFEQGSYIEDSLNAVRNEGILGAIFAVLVILVFLNFSLRATAVTAISIPLSIFFAFLLMRLTDYTLNLLTLSGMTVAIGRIVDDAIVVTENIYRHMQRGDPRADSVFEGTTEVTTAITASTLVTVAVFLPLGFIGGITREFFGPFGLTVTYALLASLLVAVTVVPVLAKLLMKRPSEPEPVTSMGFLQRMYAPSLEWALDHRWITLILATLFFVLSLAATSFVPKTFLPSFGEPSLTVDMALPPGTDLDTTDGIAREVEAILMDDEDLEEIETTIGGSSASIMQAEGGNSSRAYFFGTFASNEDESFWDRFSDDKLDPDKVAERVRKELAKLAAEHDMPISFTVSSGTHTGMESGVYDLQILSDDEEKLQEANALILEALLDPDNWDERKSARERILGVDEDAPEIPIINLRSNLTEARNVLSVDVDPAKAIARGLTTAQVGFALRQVLEGQDLGTAEIAVDGESETLDIVARYPDETIGSKDALADFEIMGPAGPVRLGDIADIDERPGPVEISRVDGKRAAILSGEIVGEDTFGVIGEADAIIDDLDLDDEVEVGAGVESSQQMEGFNDLLVAMVFSIIIVYLIMVVTFRSFVHPFTILFSIPFALSGALIALAITGRPLSISSLIGMLMLIGIVTTNAIVLIDLVRQYQSKRGMTPRQALMRGGVVRLRPILMTAVATILALLPQAIELSGEGGIIAADLATAVIGGLFTSTLLTLIIVPVVYSLLDRLSSGEPWDSGDSSAVPVTGGMPDAPGPSGAPGAASIQVGGAPSVPDTPSYAPPEPA